MTVVVIRKGKIAEEVPQEAICYNCDSILLYKKEDVIPTPYPDDPREEDTIVCPHCGAYTPIYWKKHAWDKKK